MTGAPTPPVILRVRVIDDCGQPIMDASVLFKEAPVDMPDIAALTDGRGEVVLAAPVAGSYALGAEAGGFAGETVAFDVGSSDEVTIEIVMTRSKDAG